MARLTRCPQVQLLAVLSVVTGLGVVTAGCQVAADGYNLNGVRQYQQGQYNAALQHFQQALAADPSSADAYYNLAATTHRLGIQNQDPEALAQAETLYNQCLDIDEDHVECHRGLAVLLVETDRSDRAFQLLKNWAMTSPGAADARVELARLYEEFGDPETAKLHLNQAIMIDQQNHRAWTALGHLREELGDYEQALANYQRSYHLNQHQSTVAARIASLHRTLGGGADSLSTGETRTVSIPGGTRYE